MHMRAPGCLYGTGITDLSTICTLVRDPARYQSESIASPKRVIGDLKSSVPGDRKFRSLEPGRREVWPPSRIDSTFYSSQSTPSKYLKFWALGFMKYSIVRNTLISAPLAPAICDFVKRTREGVRCKQDAARGIESPKGIGNSRRERRSRGC